MTDRAKIKEIFTSIQGEGPYIGVKQLFIRFCGCNLLCDYCDTDYNSADSRIYTVDELLNEVKKHSECHSVSFTGGEPLLHAGFLKEFLPLCPLPVYLETNATLVGELGEIIDYIDYVSADIKLPSSTHEIAYWSEHDNFIAKASHKILFAKVVFDENITEEEIRETVKICAKYGIEIILQPKSKDNQMAVSIKTAEAVMNKFLKQYKKVRFIPQMHKFLNIQ